MAVPAAASKSASIAGVVLVLRPLEDLPQDLDGALRVEAHLADLGLAPEGDDEQHLVGDLRDVQVERPCPRGRAG